jgi:hypothetical protein
MCLPKPKNPQPMAQPVVPPPKAPPPAEPNAAVAQAEPETATSDDLDSKRKGRTSLRIDRSVSVPSVGGTGLNIPRT